MKRDILYNIGIIGAGNVAWHLSQALEDRGFRVTDVFSRTKESARDLAKKLYEANHQTHLDFRDSKATLFIISVPDHAVAALLPFIKLPANAVLAHTSGTLPLSVLKTYQGPKGVFYPLQTFSKSKKISFKHIPICLEASDSNTKSILTDVAFELTDDVYYITSEDRKTLHIAAVFACNFTNHLLTVAQRLLKDKGIELSILKPLVEETVKKAFELGPERAQTGPAARNDQDTIESHLIQLKNEPALAVVYGMLSNSIQQSKLTR